MNKTCNGLLPSHRTNDTFENAGALTFLNMQTPTIGQIQSAIEVLTRLAERLNIQAAHSINQLPETPLGAHYAGNIGSQIIDETARIAGVTKMLEIWEDELMEQKRSTLALPKVRTRFHGMLDKCMDLEKKYFAASRIRNLQNPTLG